MRRAIFLLLLSVMAAHAAERRSPASESELAEITKRGRLLAEYDEAAWRATDALMAMAPDRGALGRYIAKKTDTGWTVVFGRLSQQHDKFLIAYEATRSDSSTDFQVRKCDPPSEDAGFYFFSVRAIEIALAAFKGESRPYNAAVLPSESGDLYVYVLPAQTKGGVFPLGGDVRYLISSDGSRILEKRQLHVAIIEFSPDPKVKTEAGVHSAVVDDAPEDTDVFHVLTRKPAVPEWVATRKYVYQIGVDGSIRYLMTAEALGRVGKK